MLLGLILEHLHMLGNTSKRAEQKHYVEFIDKYSTPRELGDNGVGIYRLRGGLAHRGDMRGHTHNSATHVLFSVPETQSKMHAFRIEADGKTPALFDLDLFIDGLDASVRHWYKANDSNTQVNLNLPHLIRYSSNGVSPFTKGLPAIVSGA
ncbi:hypothetical protein EDD53_1723 [Pacificibacter maritimus]|uniref:Uncharacterized protein n=1 Tax=Pacificibacter maritimus TaxID=762213 RepID=A0A3N4UQS6_9RHOB|nr:hypothetical protein [Pacificibacter maritimus]RPE67317.1 hypothetical protein EDD53_1723 [Pacificibacter maritimus]